MSMSHRSGSLQTLSCSDGGRSPNRLPTETDRFGSCRCLLTCGSFYGRKWRVSLYHRTSEGTFQLNSRHALLCSAAALCLAVTPALAQEAAPPAPVAPETP